MSGTEDPLTVRVATTGHSSMWPLMTSVFRSSFSSSCSISRHQIILFKVEVIITCLDPLVRSTPLTTTKTPTPVNGLDLETLTLIRTSHSSAAAGGHILTWPAKPHHLQNEVMMSSQNWTLSSSRLHPDILSINPRQRTAWRGPLPTGNVFDILTRITTQLALWLCGDGIAAG